MAKKRTRIKNTKMRRTVFGTLSAIFMVSALIVAAIPGTETEAAGDNTALEFNSDNIREENVIAAEASFEASTGFANVDELIPNYNNVENATTPIYTSSDGLFSIAYTRNTGSATYTGVVVNFDIQNVNVSNTLSIPEYIRAFQYDNGGNGTNLQAVCGDAVGYEGNPGNANNYLYYIAQDEEIVVSGNSVPLHNYTMSPCYASNESVWFSDDGSGANTNTLYQLTTNTTGLGVIQAIDGNYYMPATQLDINVQYIGSTKYNPETGKYYTDGTGVFENATQISTLNIASNILAIGNNAFVNCQFNTVSLANKVQQIGNYAFSNCNRLTTLNLYDESDRDGSAVHAATALRQIGAAAFYGCTSLRSVTIPNQVQFLGHYCFANNAALVSANLYGLDQDGNSNLTYIGDGLFYNDTALEILHIGNNVSNIDTVKYLTYDCDSLTELYLPNNAGENDQIFDANNVTGCSSLLTVYVPSDALRLECGNACEDHESDRTYTSITAADAVDCFGAANLGCHTSYPDEYQISNSFVLMGNRSNSSNTYVYAKEHGIAFGYSERGNNYYEKLSENYFYTIERPTDGTTTAALSRFSVDDGTASSAYVIIPDSIGPYTIGSISSSAFVNLADEYKTQIEYVYIPSSVTAIGDATFSGCIGLDTVRFANAMNVTEIGANAFYTGTTESDVNLKMIGTVSSGTTMSIPYQYAMTIGNTYNDPDVSQARYITYCTEFPTNLQIRLQYGINPVDNTVTSAVPTLVSIPKGAKYYSENGAFANVDYSLDSYQADAQNAVVKSALTRYLAGNLNFVDLTETEQTIVTATTVINVPYGVSAIAANEADTGVFKDNTDILTVQLNDVEGVLDRTFEGCTSLVNFTMSSSGAAAGEALGDYVFEDCPALTNVTMPATLTSIGQIPFHGATALTYVNFDNSPNFTCSDYIIYSLDGNGSKSGIVECLRVRGNAAGTSFVTASAFEGVSTIEPYAFRDCDGILTVDMSSSTVATIPEHCYDSCTNLYQCSLPETTTEIESCAFKDTKIRSILIPNTFAHISDTAFVDSDDPTNPDSNVSDVDNLIIQGYSPSTAENYANSALHPTFIFEVISAAYTVTFIDGYDNSVLHTESVGEGLCVSQVTWAPPSHEGVLFSGWDPANYYETPVTGNMTVTATYEASASANYTLTFVDDDGTVLYRQTVLRDGYASAPPITPSKSGYTFIGWDPSNYNSIPITKDMTVTAQYYYTGETEGDGTNDDGSNNNNNDDDNSNKEDEGGSGSGNNNGSSSTGNTSSVTSPNTTLQGTVSNNSTTGTTSTPSTSTGGSTTSGTRRPSSSNGTVSGNGTKVNVTKTGISNTGLVSATVNGANGDNYVVKISDSEEARTAVQQALLGEFGSLDAIKYFAMDISLYDSTGTTKLENVSGVTVTVTIPIPDALLTYGGNNRAGAVSGSALEKLETRFTTIDGVPCMSFTARHFSPYTVYVDTNNLSATGIGDVTPQTGDPIAPKWFLVMGLMLLSILTFLMRGRKVVRVII